MSHKPLDRRSITGRRSSTAPRRGSTRSPQGSRSRATAACSTASRAAPRRSSARQTRASSRPWTERGWYASQKKSGSVPSRARRHAFLARALKSYRCAAPLFGTIRKSSGFWPASIAMVSHRGFMPRPLQVLPSGPRYFGATSLRFAFRSSGTAVVRIPLPPVSRSSSFRNCCARLSSSAAISSRNLQRASFDRLSRAGRFIIIPRKINSLTEI
jgi:hypothetical protein